jgi:hypothetical protein
MYQISLEFNPVFVCAWGVKNMKFTRRKFIQSSAAAALAATLGHAAGGTSVARGLALDPLTYLKREHFEPFIDAAFIIRNDAGRTATVRLREAFDLKESINEKRGFVGDSFRLGFNASRKADLGQGTYHFDHENLGRFSLFLAPIGGSGIRYEAIINRIC